MTEEDYRFHINWENISYYEFTLGSSEKTNLLTMKVWALPYRKNISNNSELAVAQCMANSKEEAIVKFKESFGIRRIRVD